MKRALTIAALLALCLPLAASENLYQSSVSAGRWLNLPFSTRAAGLAGLGATGQGVDALSYNPAGLAQTLDYQASLAQDYWLTDASSQRLGLALPLGDGGLGLAFDNVDFGSVDQYSVNAGQVSALGSVNPDAWAIQAGYGLNLGPLSLGAALQGLNQDLGGPMQDGYSLDLGAGLRTGDLNLGLSLLQAVGSLGGEGLPRNLDAEADWAAWSYGEAEMDVLAGGTWQISDQTATAALGLEAKLNRILTLRGGYRAANGQGAGGWATGLGLRPLPWLGLDYAYNAVGGLQATNQLTLNVYWGGGAQATAGPTKPSPETPTPVATSTPAPSPTPIQTPAPTPIPTSTPTTAPATALALLPAAPAMPAAPEIAAALPLPRRPLPKSKRSYTVVVLAGNGRSGFSGDGRKARRATLNGPLAVADGPDGKVFIADEDNQRVREVFPTGRIFTLAGTGKRGGAGDGGPADRALLNFPVAVAADGAGDVFIADWGNNRVRKVDTSGIISTVAGDGTQGFSGDGGPALSAELSHPLGVAVDGAGDLFISDSGNNRIREVSPAGLIRTIAGTGLAAGGGDGGAATSAGLSKPAGIAVDASGDVFIADSGNHRIREVEPSGLIRTAAGTGQAGFGGDGGPAEAAKLRFPGGVAVDDAGDLFIADGGNQRIRTVNAAGTIRTLAGTGRRGRPKNGSPGVSTALNWPSSVAVGDRGLVFVANYGSQQVLVLK